MFQPSCYLHLTGLCEVVTAPMCACGHRPTPTPTLTNMSLDEGLWYLYKEALFVSFDVLQNSPGAETVAVWARGPVTFRRANKLKRDSSDQREQRGGNECITGFIFMPLCSCRKQHGSLWAFLFFFLLSLSIILMLWDFSPSNIQQISPRRMSDLCLHIIFLVWILGNRKAK